MRLGAARDHRVRRDRDVGEGHFGVGRIVCKVARFERCARRVGGNETQQQFAVVIGSDDETVGGTGQRDAIRAAREHVAIAVASGPWQAAARAAPVRRGAHDGPPRTAADIAKQPVPVRRCRGRREHVNRESRGFEHGLRRDDATQFFSNDGGRGEVEAEAVAGFRHEDRGPPEFDHLLPHGGIEIRVRLLQRLEACGCCITRAKRNRAVAQHIVFRCRVARDRLRCFAHVYSVLVIFRAENSTTRPVGRSRE